MAWHGRYTSDLGRSWDYVTLTPRFESDEEISLPGELELLPPTWRGQLLPGLGPCSIPRGITPRYVLLHLSDILRFRFPLPFRPGGDNWNQCIAEIPQLPGVRAWELRGERLSPYHTHSILG